MTRDQHLEFCVRCLNRKFDPQQGIVCGLTNRIADFENRCPSFSLDESVKIDKKEEEAIPNHEVVKNLTAEAHELLRKQQDVGFAVIGGVAAAIVGAVIWAVITVITEYQIGYMAIGVGLLVGFSVRYFGCGIDQHFGYIGAFFALAGCALGNLLSQIGFIAQSESLGYFETITLLNLDVILSVYRESFSPMDLLFYGIAAYEGYKFAFRLITDDLISAAKKGILIAPPLNKYRLPIVFVLFVAIGLTMHFLSKGASGVTTTYYESGAMRFQGELQNGKEQGFWTYYWENGQKQYTGYYTDGKQDSLWNFFNEDGTLYRKGSFLRGVQHGSWTDFYSNGKISAAGNYVKARQHGPWEFFYEDGQLSHKGDFYLDQPNGAWEYYYPNGQLSSKGNYSEGENTGIWNYWREDGTKNEEIEFTNDKFAKILNSWDDNGKQVITAGMGKYTSYTIDHKLAEQGEIVDGYRSGTWFSYYSSGKKSAEYNFTKGEAKLVNTWDQQGNLQIKNGNGIFKRYNDMDTLVLETGLIKTGKREGLWKLFNENGSLTAEITYETGKLNGPYKVYFESGEINFEGFMTNDKREGEWKWFYETGQVESVATFKGGKKIGEQTFYDETGRLVRTENYANGKLEKSVLNED
ncbi:MAG: hypothetical protein EBR30_17880 [Cytophagia bacterium]|nr:hypothetical protein [Cytophagia bacterium]NBW36854.1 hypothetical protein [Cytophagia bacterium]